MCVFSPLPYLLPILCRCFWQDQDLGHDTEGAHSEVPVPSHWWQDQGHLLVSRQQENRHLWGRKRKVSSFGRAGEGGREGGVGRRRVALVDYSCHLISGAWMSMNVNEKRMCYSHCEHYLGY